MEKEMRRDVAPSNLESKPILSSVESVFRFSREITISAAR